MHLHIEVMRGDAIVNIYIASHHHASLASSLALIQELILRNASQLWLPRFIWQRPIVLRSAVLFSRRVAHSKKPDIEAQLRAGMSSRKGAPQRDSASKREVVHQPRNIPPHDTHWQPQAPPSLLIICRHFPCVRK